MQGRAPLRRGKEDSLNLTLFFLHHRHERALHGVGERSLGSLSGSLGFILGGCRDSQEGRGRGSFEMNAESAWQLRLPRGSAGSRDFSSSQSSEGGLTLHPQGWFLLKALLGMETVPSLCACVLASIRKDTWASADWI